MIANVFSRRCRSYKMYLEGDSPHQVVIIVCELKWFSHISNCHNMYTLMQSCDAFHTQHVIFFATLDTCAGTMWFGHYKVLHVFMHLDVCKLFVCWWVWIGLSPWSNFFCMSHVHVFPMHTYSLFNILVIFELFGTFLIVFLSPSLSVYVGRVYGT